MEKNIEGYAFGSATLHGMDMPDRRYSGPRAPAGWPIADMMTISSGNGSGDTEIQLEAGVARNRELVRGICRVILHMMSSSPTPTPFAFILTATVYDAASMSFCPGMRGWS